MVPSARIGFFLHIPFPPPEVFEVLPWHGEFLRGLLDADLIGFHTTGYERNFRESLRRLSPLGGAGPLLVTGRPPPRTGVFPMGVDVAAWEARASGNEVEARSSQIRADAGGRHLLVGLDRLDYTKGIPHRLAAFERLLRSEPGLADRARLLQATVPSRQSVESYAVLRHHIEEQVGRINSAYATTCSVPVHSLCRGLPDAEVTAFYRAADVMLVTPLRDGMNLVAKEFVASRTDGDGVLVLSRFAGASAELQEALVVNPYDIDELAAAMRRALSMPTAERRQRMTGLRTRVRANDVRGWSAAFIRSLRGAPGALPRDHLTQPEPRARRHLAVV
jgi:trehalose 6-phosphate synthase/phosphatase